MTTRKKYQSCPKCKYMNACHFLGFFYLLVYNRYKVLSRKNNFLEKWSSSSEWTLIIKLWSRIFETLFEDTIINLVW